MFPWKKNEVIFLYNTNTDGKPRYCIHNIEKNEEKHYKIDYEKNKDSNLTEAYYCDGEKDLIIYEEMTENGIWANSISHNSDETKIQLGSKFECKEDYKVEPHSFGTSPDGRFIIEYNEGFDINDPHDDALKDWKINFRIHSIRGIRLLTQFLLQKAGITEKYGAYITKEIIETLGGKA